MKDIFQSVFYIAIGYLCGAVFSNYISMDITQTVWTNAWVYVWLVWWPLCLIYLAFYLLFWPMAIFVVFVLVAVVWTMIIDYSKGQASRLKKALHKI